MKIPGLGARAVYVAEKSVHLPHKEDVDGRAGKYLERDHIEIDGLIPVASAGGREYVCVVVDGYTRAVYTRPLRLKSEAVEAFKASRGAAENEPGKHDGQHARIIDGQDARQHQAVHHGPIRPCI